MSLLLLLGGGGGFTVDTSPAVMTDKIEIDWTGDGLFTGANENITAYVLTWECERGRDRADLLRGRASAGQASILLDNQSGLFSPFNSGGALFGFLRPNRKVRITVNDGTHDHIVWTGYTHSIDPEFGPDHQKLVRITALGGFERLDRAKVTVPTAKTKTTSFLAGIVLDAAGWPVDERTISTGNITVGDYIEDTGITALAALRNLEDSEFGFVYEAADGKVVFENRDYRSGQARSNTSQATYSDNNNAAHFHPSAIAEGDPFERIVNRVELSVRTFTVGAAAVVWTSVETPITVASSASWTFYAVSASPVDTWTTPVVGTDIIAANPADHALLFVNVTEQTSTKLTFSVTNSNVGATSLTTVQARASSLTAANPTAVIRQDATSQAEFGVRVYAASPKFLASVANAQTQGDNIITRFKNPVPQISVVFPAKRNKGTLHEVLVRDVSDRVTLTANTTTGMGLSADFWIETIHHRRGQDGMLWTTFDLAAVAGVAAGTPAGGASNTGATSPGTLADDAGIGDTAWTNPGNAATSNDVRATCTLGRLAKSHYLKATNFGFALPLGATPRGVKVEIERRYTTAVARDASVRLVVGGAVAGADRAKTTEAWPSTDAYSVYGSSSDLWEVSGLTRAQVNAVDFGVVVAALTPGGAGGQPEIDHIRITVYYDP